MAAVAQPIPPVMIDGKAIQVFRNDKAFTADGKKKTFCETVTDYSALVNFAFRSLQGMERVTKMIVEVLDKMGSSMKSFFQARAKELLIAWTWLTIPRLPSVTKDMIRSWKETKERKTGEIQGTQNRKWVEFVKNTSDAIASYFYAASLLLGSGALKNAGDVADLANNSADLGLSAQDHMLATKASKIAIKDNVDTQVQEALKNTQKYTALKVAKAACSVLSGALGLLLLAFGGPILPALALIAVSLAGTVFAMWNSLYKEASPYQMVDFFNTRHVQAAPTV